MSIISNIYLEESKEFSIYIFCSSNDIKTLYQNYLEFINELIVLADILLVFAEEGMHGEFIDKLENYLGMFEELEIILNNVSLDIREGNAPKIKSSLDRLWVLHQHVSKVSDTLKDILGSNLDDLHERSNYLRKYISGE
jgi:hypothetical protein